MTTSTHQSPPPGYEDVSVPFQAIAQSGLIFSLLLLFVPLVIYWTLYDFGRMFDYGRPAGEVAVILLVITILAVVVHEMLHAIGWMVAGGLSWSQIRFGVDKKTLSPYTHAQVPMTATAYRIGSVLPGIITGLLPAVVGLISGNGPLTMFGAVMLSAAIGDIFVLWIIRKVPGNALVLDHPSQAGCMVKMRDA